MKTEHFCSHNGKIPSWLLKKQQPVNLLVKEAGKAALCFALSSRFGDFTTTPQRPLVTYI